MLVLNGWFVIGGFIAIILALWIMGNVLGSKIAKMNTRYHVNARRTENEISQLYRKHYDSDERIGKLENPPPPPEPSIEVRLCPECNEEKEVVDGDYLCSDCRQRENIAA